MGVISWFINIYKPTYPWGGPTFVYIEALFYTLSFLVISFQEIIEPHFWALFWGVTFPKTLRSGG